MKEPLSDYFTWHEATFSETAVRKRLDNTPNEDVQAVIRETAMHMDIVRRLLNAPVIVSSWYRSPAVNTAIGSKPSSQHIRGEAVDFRCPEFGDVQEVFDFLRLHDNVDYDQIILEFGSWVHISFAQGARRRALIIDHDGTRYV